MKRRLYLLVYDIVDDGRRAKIARRCQATADRVQRSVFEGYYTSAELKKLLDQVTPLLQDGEDSLRIYSLCESCRSKVATYGQGTVTPPPNVIIV